jgi:uncharacterized phiE125 gp8 family phage protein
MIAFTKLITAPIAEPLSFSEVKAFLREPEDDDQAIERARRSARSAIERWTNRALMPQTHRLTISSFPETGKPILLLPAPVISLESFSYLDGAGATQAVDEDIYKLKNTDPGEIWLKSGFSWPEASLEAGSIEIEFIAGHESAEDIPIEILQALLLLTSHFYENRQIVTTGGGQVSRIPLSVEDLLGPYMLREGF